MCTTRLESSIRIGLTCAVGTLAILALAGGEALSQGPAGIPGVVAPGVSAEEVGTFGFTEGPVGAADGSLYFSDNRLDRVYHLDPAGKVSVFRENADRTSGLALTRDGELLFAERTQVSKRNRDGAIVTLTNSFQGQPFGAVNDLIADARGGV
jgi:hypothetical protein